MTSHSGQSVPQATTMMDDASFPSSPRPNTSSTTNLSLSQLSLDGVSHHGWSFLQQSNLADPNTSPRSLPPSTYIRSSTSTSSQSPLNNLSPSSHPQRLSRSLLNQFSTSAGTGTGNSRRSITTSPSLPSQPVLLRINSNNAYTHTSRMPRRATCVRPISVDRTTNLPSLEEFSVQGILSAIEEDIEGDLNVISEVLGRSRFVLADQYESQMAPLGEIRGSAIDAIGEEGEETGLVLRTADDVIILREDASLVDGSNSGSAAYGLLERLQAVPRGSGVPGDSGAERSFSNDVAPVTVDDIRHNEELHVRSDPAGVHDSRELTATRPDGPARAVVSETYLSAEADGVSSGIVPMISESGRHYPLYTHDDTDLFNPAMPRESTSPTRRSGYVSGFDGITNWLSRRTSGAEMDAEARLRGLLNRQGG